MVKINKTMPAPAPITSDADYRNEPIFGTLCKDFHEKCYLCENKLRGINVEHIVPHKGKHELKYKWGNLFLACVHCNGTKLAQFDNILDCTKVDPESIIDFGYEPFPISKLKLKLKDDSGDYADQGEQTIELLNKIFDQPGTPIKSKEAETLHDDLNRELNAFTDALLKYKEATDTHQEQCYTYASMHLGRGATFAAFKRALARKSEWCYEIFEEELEK